MPPLEYNYITITRYCVHFIECIVFIFVLNFLGTEIKLQDIKTEPSSMFFGSPFGPLTHDSKQGLVSVAITLRPAAAEVRILEFTQVSTEIQLRL